MLLQTNLHFRPNHSDKLNTNITQTQNTKVLRATTASTHIAQASCGFLNKETCFFFFGFYFYKRKIAFLFQIIKSKLKK